MQLINNLIKLFLNSNNSLQLNINLETSEMSFADINEAYKKNILFILEGYHENYDCQIFLYHDFISSEEDLLLQKFEKIIQTNSSFKLKLKDNLEKVLIHDKSPQ